MSLTDKVINRLFGRIIEQHVQQAVKVIDDRWWTQISGTSQAARLDLNWSEHRTNLEDCLSEWRTNPLAFRITALTTDFVVGTGIVVRSRYPAMQSFVDRFWNHPQNQMQLRLYKWSDELVRTGELFIVLSRNPGDGMSYVREVPAMLIDQIETDPNDVERELRYHQVTDSVEGHWWPASGDNSDGESQVMLHFAINRPAGAVRGTPDLLPILRWLRRYQDWVEDRARLNKYRSAFLWHVQVSNPPPGELERKRAQYAKVPSPGSIIISDQNEKWVAVSTNIAAEEAADDGKAIRLMVAAGAGIPLHFLGEGESATRATAKEMGQPTYRHFKHRQTFFGNLLLQVIETAIRRAARHLHHQTDPGLSYEVEDMTREDFAVLATAAAQIVSALATMKDEGWIDDYHASSIAFRFAGEMMSPEEINNILASQPQKGDVPPHANSNP